VEDRGNGYALLRSSIGSPPFSFQAPGVEILATLSDLPDGAGVREVIAAFP
jgi:hypothetical protein